MASGERAEGLGIDPELVRALAAGRLDRAAELRSRSTDLSPIVESLVDAELATRRGQGAVAALVELATRVEAEAGDDPLLRWWAAALLAERCALDLDVAGTRRAAAVVDEVPDDALVPVVVLWIRGRLRRAAGMVKLYGPHPDRAGFRRLRSQAIADFTRGGFYEEVAVTRVTAATIQAVWLREDIEQNLAAAVDARATVDARSGWSTHLDSMLAALGVAAGDRALADRSLAAQADVRPPFLWGVTAPVLRALRDLEDSGGAPSAIAALVEAAVQVGGDDPLGGYRMRLVAASVLMDHGQGVMARELALPVLDMPAVDQVDELERDILALRLRLDAGGGVLVGQLTAALDRLAALGHAARGGLVAEQLADDLTRIGRTADADALRAHRPGSPSAPRQIDRLPRVHDERSAPGDEWSTSGHGERSLPGDDARPAVGVRVQVMAPVVTVDVAGERRDLRTTAVRLLLALLLAHPAPLPAETAADALWPTAPWDSDRRRRLNTVVHRLRQGLGAAGGAVGRVGDLLTLTTDGWDVDLFRLREALGRTPTEGPHDDDALGEALADVSGNLAHAQFPYDDQLVDERQMLLAAVSRRLGTGAAPAAAPVPPTEHAEVLRVLGAPPPLSTR